MPKIRDDEKHELLRVALSKSITEDMEIVAKQRHNPFVVDGKVDMDRVLDFLNDYNEFINHQPKPFKPISDKDMRL